MKKITLLCLTLLTFWSCGDEVEFNTPGFQGNKNYNLWKASTMNALISNGDLIITARNNGEKLMLTLSASTPNTYLLSDTSISRADFEDFEDIEYSTSYAPDPNVSLYPEIGEVIITESTSDYVSGTFRFIAFTSDGLKFVGFNEGEFYRIPINGGINTVNTISCQQATSNLATATTNFLEVAQGDPQYASQCAAYKLALQEIIAVCGDEGGVYQSMIDSLGDCN